MHTSDAFYVNQTETNIMMFNRYICHGMIDILEYQRKESIYTLY